MREQAENELRLKQIISRMDLTYKCKPFGMSYTDEELVDIRYSGIGYDAYYLKQGLKTATRNSLARRGVAERLVAAQNLLKEITYSNKGNYSLLVYDAFRSFETQYEIYESFREAILKENQNISEYELDKKLSEMVSKPIKQLDLPPFHSTGGAVDLTICINGRPLNMGTEFDSTSKKAHTDYYETLQIDSQVDSQVDEIKHNRRLLYHIMTESGFVNYSYEWWHYSYGDRLWSAINKCDAIYGMVDKI